MSIIETGSIAAAAEANSIAPSAVSRRISELESRLGTPLLLRQPRGVSPTPAGEALARHSENLVSLMRQMDAEMSEYAKGVRGHVRIAANTSAITQFLPRDLALFRRMHPDINIALNETTSEQAVDDVIKGLADIAVFSETIEPVSLEVFPYHQDSLMLLCPKGHVLSERASVSFRDTLDFPHVGLTAGSSLLSLLQAQAGVLDKAIAFAVQVSSFEGVRRMVESGLGVAILPDGSVLPDFARDRLDVIPLRDGWARRNLCFGVRREQDLTVAARNMLKGLQGREE